MKNKPKSNNKPCPADKKANSKREFKKQLGKFLISLTACAAICIFCVCLTAGAESTLTLNLGTGTEDGDFGPLELLFLLSFIALIPSVLMMVTSFARIIIVLSFLRNAMGTQQSPPNQVLIGLALFLTLFIMSPVISQINTVAYQPLKAGEITQQQAFEAAAVPLKTFMLKQTNVSDLNMFLSLSGQDKQFEKSSLENPEQLTSLSYTVIIPSFMTSELKRAFLMGFLLYIPFMIIDLVVSSALMSMGMVMLPPSMISLPFKIMIFVLVDGWGLLFETLVNSFVT